MSGLLRHHLLRGFGDPTNTSFVDVATGFAEKDISPTAAYWKARKEDFIGFKPTLPDLLKSVADRADKFIKQEPNPDEEKQAEEAGEQFQTEGQDFIAKWSTLKGHLQQFADRHDRLRKYVQELSDDVEMLK
mmetsp:Transcript_18813/g.47034  ORF Transcript_18813/g.47034 Transcript_18813/m.47034 type:complete len:132 (-) Transcript_18813:911-1306(-)